MTGFSAILLFCAFVSGAVTVAAVRGGLWSRAPLFSAIALGSGLICTAAYMEWLPIVWGYPAAAINVWTLWLPLLLIPARNRAVLKGDATTLRRLTKLLGVLQIGMPQPDLSAAPPPEEVLRARLGDDDPEVAATAAYQLALARLADEDFAAALAMLDRIPRAAQPLSIRARLLAELGQLEAARSLLATLDAVIEKHPGFRHTVQVGRLQVLALHGRVPEVDALLASPSLSFLEPEPRQKWAAVARQRAEAGAPADDADALAAAAMEARFVPDGTAQLFEAAPVTGALLITLAFVHVLVELTGGSTDSWNLARWGASFSDLVIGPQPWRVVSAMFLHFGWGHLAVNAFALWSVGRDFEARYGGAVIWCVFFISGAAGNGISALTTTGAAVGASGAILGIIGADLAGLMMRRQPLPEWYRKQALNGIATTAVLTAGLVLTSLPVAHMAHLAGAVGGGVAMLFAAAAARPLAGLALLLTLATVGAAATSPTTRAVVMDGVELQLPIGWMAMSEEPGSLTVVASGLTAGVYATPDTSIAEQQEILDGHVASLIAEGWTVVEAHRPWTTDGDLAHGFVVIEREGRRARYGTVMQRTQGWWMIFNGWCPDDERYFDALIDVVQTSRLVVAGE